MLYREQFAENNNAEFFSQSYQMFEFINYNTDEDYQEETVITVTNCLGKTNLLSSSSYNDAKTGVMTQIQPSNIWSSNGITSALVDISHGYYYIGIADATKGAQENLYTVKVSSAAFSNGKHFVMERAFAINWAVKATASVII